MSVHLIILSLLWCWTEPCEPAHHYCVNGHPMNIQMGGSYHLDETIIPDIPDEPRYKRGIYRHCNWEITVDETEHHNSQIVMAGVNLETDDLTGSSNKTQVNILLNGNENVTLGMFQVKPLSQRKHISVQINWDPKTQSKSPVNLRILIPVAGFCSRDMLSFNGSCHAITTVPANITEAVEHCSGDAMLASFTSMAQINEFIAANEARENYFPYKSPMDLSEWLRVGMFYTDGAIQSVVRTDMGFELIEVDKNLFQVSRLDGLCGSVRVDGSGKAELQFGNCEQQMKALISFPEVASKSVQTGLFNDSKTFLPKIQQLITSINLSKHTAQQKDQLQAATEDYPGNSHSGFSHISHMHIFIYVILSIVGLNLIVMSLLILSLLKTRKQRKLNGSNMTPSEMGIQAGSLHVATPATPEFHGQQMAGSCMDEKEKFDVASPLLT